MNFMPKVKTHIEFCNKIFHFVVYLSNHSRSLINDVDSNIAEQFNMAKRPGYMTRCFGAVISFYTKTNCYSLNKQIHGENFPYEKN